MKHIRLFRIVSWIFALGLIVNVATTTFLAAQSPDNSAAQGIQISPTLYELNAERGKTYRMDLKVMNVSVSDMVYTTSVEDFVSANETGSPHILIDSDLPETSSIKTWVSAISEFTLVTRESIELDVTITIPNDAEPGGHYGVLRFSGQPPEMESTGVGLSASAGVLMLVRVAGDINESASLASFYTAKNDKQSFFFEESPITFVTRIKNEGNVHVKPSGDIEVRDMFGNLTASFPINRQEPRSNVLPNSIRRYDTVIENSWMIGRYTANLTLGYGTTGQAITNTISFWVIPYKAILVVITVLISIVYILKMMLKSYNRRIVEKVKNEIAKQNKNQSKKQD